MVASLSRRSDQLINALGAVTLVMLLVTLYMALVKSPPDYVMKDSVRILYFHAPAAWLAYLSYAVTAFASVVYLWKRDRRWDRIALASAELAVVFTSLTLVLGSLWGKSVWGTWWTWDTRLTLTLILWFVFVGYLMLRAYTEESSQQATLAAVLSLMSIPAALTNHFAVLWWRTQHPGPIVVRPGGPSLDSTMSTTLMLGVLTYTLLYVYLMIQRVRLERDRDAVEQLKQSLSS